MSRKPQRYLSYLLRLWPVGSEEEQVWRASVESSLTGDCTGFASLEDLFDFSRQQTSAAEVGREHVKHITLDKED